MWGRCVARAVAVAAIGTATAVPSVAWAQLPGDGPGDPLHGDLDGDGVTDRATLVAGDPGECVVSVELGDGSGGYEPPTEYAYPAPGTPVAYCPDMGVIVDLGGDGVAELVLAWFAGAPDGFGYDLLVLRDHTPAGGFDAIFQPSNIGLADFNGDGLQDVYEWTDQGEGFRSFLNTPGSQLVAGPVEFCFSNLPVSLELEDFDGDGAMDVMIAYSGAQGCPVPEHGVVVVLDDGTVVQLQESDTEPTWSAEVVDANGDGVPDVRTVSSDTGEVTHFIGNGDGTFTPAPTAIDDAARVRRRQQTAIAVLDNDAATASATLSVVTPPRYGTLTITPEREIAYRHRRGHTRSDSFVYRVTDDGKTDTATVTVSVQR